MLIIYKTLYSFGKKKFENDQNNCFYFVLKNILYCLAEISEILLIDRPDDWSMEVYKNFLTVFTGSFYGSCRDLVELKHLVIIFIYLIFFCSL